MVMVKRVCSYCNQEFERDERPSKPKAQRYFCNREHAIKWRQESPDFRNPKTLQTITCVNCGKERTLNRNDSDDAINRFCSLECYHEWRSKNGQPSIRKRVYFNCEFCGKKFSKPKCHANRAKHHFCSDECHGKYRNSLPAGSGPLFSQQLIECDTCGKLFYRKLSHVERNENNFCSKKCRTVWQNTPEMKEFYRENMLDILSTYPRRTKPEMMVAEYLTSQDIEFIEQETINNRFCVDFFVQIPNSNGIIIEVLGDYFHCNPLIYPEPINNMQKENLANDKRKSRYLRKCGYIVYGIWEKDILENIENAMSEVIAKYDQLAVS